MEKKIKDAFDGIAADERLLRRTKAALRKKSFDYGRDVPGLRRRRWGLVSSLAVLVLVIGGLGLYRLPTAAIDIDINPSMELRINAFDKVICAKGMNDDGRAILEDMELTNLPYTKAMRRILLSDNMEPYLEGEELLSITVVGRTLEQDGELLRNVVCCANSVTKEENLYYCRADGETAQAAREAGLTVARYLALQQLREQDPTVTAEEVQAMSMRHIKELLGCEKLETPCDYTVS